MSSPPIASGRFSNNFVEMFLGWPSIRFLQAKLIGRKSMAARGQVNFALYGYSENLTKIFFSDSVWPIFKRNCRNVPLDRLFHISFSHVDWSKNSFALYGYSENLKNLLQSVRPIFKWFCRNVPWLTNYQIPSSQVDWSKTMAASGRGYFAFASDTGPLGPLVESWLLQICCLWESVILYSICVRIVCYKTITENNWISLLAWYQVKTLTKIKILLCFHVNRPVLVPNCHIF